MKFFTTTKDKTKRPSSAVFLLHGWGANGQDLISIAEMWQDHLPNTVFIYPEAPDICEGNPFGFQWFGLGDWTSDDIARGAEKAFNPLNDFIKKQLQGLDIENKNTVLMGFSQGMMMALYAGLRQEQPLAGILGYSGALVGADDAIPATYPKTDICLIHGQADPVVPAQMHDMAVDWLSAHEYQVESLKISGLAHGIEEKGLSKGLAFIQKHLR